MSGLLLKYKERDEMLEIKLRVVQSPEADKKHSLAWLASMQRVRKLTIFTEDKVDNCQLFKITLHHSITKYRAGSFQQSQVPISRINAGGYYQGNVR